MIRFYILVLLSVLLQGCHGRKRGAGDEEKVISYPTAVVMPFAYDDPVQAEDAGNFTDYFAAALRERGFQINISAEAVADFSQAGQQGNTGLLQGLADKYELEGIILGKLQKFSYQREGRSFVIAAEADVEVVDLHNGRQVCQTTQKLTRRFRVRNARQTDFSSQNIEFLRQFTNVLIGDLVKNWLLQEKISDAKAPVSGLTALESDSANQTEKVVPGLKVKSEKASGRSDLKERLEDRLESLRENLSQSEEPGKNVQAPHWQELQSSSERVPTISVHRSEADQSADSPSSVAVNSVQDGIKLSLPGFQLVYPLEFDPAKKYEKFYYLLEQSGSQVGGEATVEDSVEENLVMEVFAAVNSFAVGRFLADYFQGVNPAPLSGIPEAFERNYLGKYQLGFMMGENAVIATGHRKYRSEILDGLSRFFENNGGVSLQSVIQDVAAHAAEAGRNNFVNSPEKPVSASLKQVNPAPKVVVSVKDSESSKPSVSVKTTVQPVTPVAAVKLPVQVRVPATTTKPPVQARVPATTVKPLVQARVPATTVKPSVQAKAPALTNKPSVQSGLSAVRSDSSVSVQPPAPQFTNSQPAAPAQLQESATQPDARFFYNLGERYFHMQDYENAARFFADARKKGFRSSELQTFEAQLAIIMGNEPVAIAEEAEEKEDTGEIKDSVSAAFVPHLLPPVSGAVTQVVAQTAAAVFMPATTGNSVVLEYEKTADDEVRSPIITGGTVLPHVQDGGLMDDFYLEMDKIEAELEKIKKNRQGLSTKGLSCDMSDISVLILKILLLLGGCLAAFSFLSTKNIK